MVDVFAEWSGNAPVDRCGIPDRGINGCSDLLKVRWQESFVADGGRRLICHFRAPDAESVRMALRRANILVESVWSGTVHEAARAHSSDFQAADFSPPLPAGATRTLATAREEWVVPNKLALTRAIVSSDRTRVIGVCDTPDASTSLLSRTANQERRGNVLKCRRLAAGPGSSLATQTGVSVLVWPGDDFTPDTRPLHLPAAP
jgi:hypothetical protein